MGDGFSRGPYQFGSSDGQNVLLVYEFIPERTEVYLLEGLTLKETLDLVKLQGLVVNHSKLTRSQEAAMTALGKKLNDRCQGGGEWCKFKKEGSFEIPPGTTFVWCGFAL